MLQNLFYDVVFCFKPLTVNREKQLWKQPG